ncbi:alpha/beta fold hydrolase [Lentzea sp.]|uniref:alpha/beta fold hydrolase n=1 Tax=Lentzea sp. TaxID=56099 RepID=UPI002ED0F88D
MTPFNDPARALRTAALRADVHRFLSERLTAATVPSRVVVVDELPKLPNGKLDRSRLGTTGAGEEVAFPGEGRAAPATPQEQAAAALWTDLLGRSVVDAEADFFDLGGNSLTLVQMASRWTARTGTEIDLVRFLEAPSVRRLARMTGEATSAAVNGDFGSPEDLRSLLEVAVLPPDIAPEAGAVPATPPFRHVLVIPGGGFVGRSVVRELLDTTAATVHVLVRASGPGDGRDRLLRDLAEHGLTRESDGERLVAVPGDLASPFLGLDPPTYRRLVGEVEMVVHGGAVVDPLASFRQLHASNVLGTREVLRFAATGVVKEVRFLAPRGAAPTSTGAGQSVWVCEQHLRQASARGIPTLVVPQGLPTGAPPGSSFAEAMINGCRSLRLAPDVDFEVPLTPVRSLVTALAGTSDDVTTVVVWWQEIIADIRASGRTLDVVPYPEWRGRLLEVVADGRLNDLTTFVPLLGEDGLFRALGHQRAPAEPASPAEPVSPGGNADTAGLTLPWRDNRVSSVTSGLVITEHVVTVPLDHRSPGGPVIEVFAQEVVAGDRRHDDLPWLLFLQGGPGGMVPRPAGPKGWLEAALREHRVLLLDQRGCGRSSPITEETAAGRSAEELARHLSRFRADSIVADAEVLRNRVAGGRPWALLGQSYGGFVALTYLSVAPEALTAVYVSGGLPAPMTAVDEVYRHNYRQVVQKNSDYYRRFPQDIALVRALADHLDEHEVLLPGGDRLTSRRMRLLGRRFGMSDGFERTHRVLAEAWDGTGVSEAFRRAVHDETGPIYSPLYALQEFIYARPGHPTRWAAERVLREFGELAEDRTPLLLTGEMMYPWMFRDFTGLRSFAAAADVLANASDLPALYDPRRLAASQVPLVALIAPDDMYTPSELQLRTAEAVGNSRVWFTGAYQHNAAMRDPGILLHMIEMAR